MLPARAMEVVQEVVGSFRVSYDMKLIIFHIAIIETFEALVEAIKALMGTLIE